MAITRNLVAAPFQVMRVVGFLASLVGGIISLGWYITWLDNYFFWRIVADIAGVLTCFLIPLVALIEWAWHGWPSDITMSVYICVGGYLVAIIGGVACKFILTESN